MTEIITTGTVSKKQLRKVGIVTVRERRVLCRDGRIQFAATGNGSTLKVGTSGRVTFTPARPG